MADNKNTVASSNDDNVLLRVENLSQHSASSKL